MDSSSFIAIYLPIFMLLFVILPTMNKKKMTIQRLRKKRSETIMTNHLFMEYIGKHCSIITSFGRSFKQVKILAVEENWLKISKKGTEHLLNIDLIESLKILP
jgi:hypothetical protein